MLAERADERVPNGVIRWRLEQSLVSTVIVEGVIALPALALCHRSRRVIELKDRLQFERDEIIGDEINIVKMEWRPGRRRHAHIIVQPTVHSHAVDAELRRRRRDMRSPVDPRSELRVAAADARFPYAVREGGRR